MRVVHLADLHLGFRQYERLNPAGANVREADVALALSRAIDGIIPARPDLILVAGDVFHAVRPPNSAILSAIQLFSRLRAALPTTPVVMIGGDHDTPRSSETKAITALYQVVGVDVVQDAVQVLERAGAVVTAVPLAALGQLAQVHPVPGRVNILVAHGEARDLPHQARTIGADVLGAGWDYVALGHYHVHQQVGPRAWYAGSLEYVSTDPWKDLREQERAGLPGKGWVLAEIGQGEPVIQFQPIVPPRLLVDLPSVAGDTGLLESVNAEILERLAAVPDGAVARLVVHDVSRDRAKGLDWEAIRGHKARLLMLHLDIRRTREEAATIHRQAVYESLDQIVDAHLATWKLDPDLEPHRAEFLRLGREAMAKVSAEGIAPAAAAIAASPAAA